MKDINFKVEQGDVVGIIGYGHYGMNANKRIAINAIATYSRTLLRMALGLFSGRWVLQSLGEVDYGRYDYGKYGYGHYGYGSSGKGRKK